MILQRRFRDAPGPAPRVQEGVEAVLDVRLPVLEEVAVAVLGEPHRGVPGPDRVRLWVLARVRPQAHERVAQLVHLEPVEIRSHPPRRHHLFQLVRTRDRTDDNDQSPVHIRQRFRVLGSADLAFRVSGEANAPEGGLSSMARPAGRHEEAGGPRHPTALEPFDCISHCTCENAYAAVATSTTSVDSQQACWTDSPPEPPVVWDGAPLSSDTGPFPAAHAFLPARGGFSVSRGEASRQGKLAEQARL